MVKLMLSPLHEQLYRQLRADLAKLQSQVEAEFSVEVLRPPAAELEQQFQTLLTFESECSETELELTQVNRLRSLQTEIHKQLRVLHSDLSFLAAARKAETRQKRRSQIGDRLRLLISYCDAIL